MALNEILELHRLWLRGDNSGECANLYGANLRGANLYGANLYGAGLRGADLSGANSRGAEGIIGTASIYPYRNYGYMYNDELRIRLGCHDRTITEWDRDFWNNDKEFPENSEAGQNRLRIYKFMKEYLINYYGSK